MNNQNRSLSARPNRLVPRSCSAFRGRVGGSRWLAAVLAVALAAVGCCTDPVTGDSYFCLGDLSDAEEAALGANYAPNFIAESGGIYPDPELHDYLSEIVIDKMALQSHRPDLPWEFHILNTSQINAFALPGGQVFVTRGLLARLESEAQFAHLMGHEIGHVSHRHSMRGQGRQLLFALLLGVVSQVEGEVGDSEFPIATAALGVAGQLTLLHYSREQELESDARGVDYALQAGYQPAEGKKTFELFLELKQASGRTPGLIEGLLSTHPLDSTRIEQIDDYIDDEYPASRRQNLTVSRPRWETLIARVRAAQDSYDEYDRAAELIAQHQRGEGGSSALSEAREMLQRGQRRLPDHAAFSLGLAFVEVEDGETRRAMRALDRAVQLDPDLYGARLLRGKVQLDLGRAAMAMGDLEAARDLFPFSPQPRLYLGEAAELLGQTAAAIESYRAALERSAEGTEVHRRASERLAALQGASAA